MISTTLGSGTIGHTGGISLTKGATTLALTDFDIKLTAANTLAASVNGASPKVEIVNLDLAARQDQGIRNDWPGRQRRQGKPQRGRLERPDRNVRTPSMMGAQLGTVIVTAQAR